jgi:hypothetical protein
MRIGITTNIKNGIGLTTEFNLLRDHLVALGHEVTGFQFDEAAPTDQMPLDLMIALETVSRHLLDLAPVNWLIPNPEWTKRHDMDLIRRSFHKILCKTREGTRIFKELYPERTFYVGFLARDQFDPSIRREPVCLHIGGNSSFRGTQAIIDAWRWTKDRRSIGVGLIVVSTALKDRPSILGVKYLERATDEEIRALQNGCLFHLYPSGTEGFGHALREGMSCNASVLVTDAPPLDEIENAHKIPATGWERYNLAKVYEVSALDIFTAVQAMKDLYDNGFRRDDTREEFLAGNVRFKANLDEHLKEFVPGTAKLAGVSGGRAKISFIGNFAASESTENMIRWALEQGLGHEVECIQENEATMRQVETVARHSDALLWVRTPGWLKIDESLVLNWLKTTSVSTASIHLDRFWGIPEREELIGRHPFWCTDIVFTADGGHQLEFENRGVNHVWMEPAVSEVYIHPGTPRDNYLCDVGFVGARDYHAEYPFRPRMVATLQRVFGARFRHITGVRGHELNDVYASMKVVVGDCIFAGSHRYWSDRVPETVGRHGFLLHPDVHSLEVPVARYRPQDVDHLIGAIEHWLGEESGRREVVEVGVAHVRKHDTWTIRMKWILDQLL